MKKLFLIPLLFVAAYCFGQDSAFPKFIVTAKPLFTTGIVRVDCKHVYVNVVPDTLILRSQLSLEDPLLICVKCKYEKRQVIINKMGEIGFVPARDSKLFFPKFPKDTITRELVYQNRKYKLDYFVEGGFYVPSVLYLDREGNSKANNDRHYYAIISVFELGRYPSLIGKVEGVFQPRGSCCDKPEEWIRKAQELSTKN